MSMRNVREQGFGFDLPKESTGFFVFGPLQAGEFIDGIQFDMTGGEAVFPGVQITCDIRISDFRPTKLTHSNGHPLCRTNAAPVLSFSFITGQQHIFTYLPIKIAASTTERYCAVLLDSADMTSDTRGLVWFDIGFDPELAKLGIPN